MSKPTPGASPTLTPINTALPPPKRVVVVRNGSNDYSVYEETYELRPVSRRLLQNKVPQTTARDEVKMWHLATHGDDSCKGCGL